MPKKLMHNLRETGIGFLKDIPWGTHICGFYQSKQDLLDILVPYFEAGLKHNEYCMCVLSDPLSISEGVLVFRAKIPNFDRYYRSGQIEILTHNEWYLKYGNFDGNKVVEGWGKKVKQALDYGYEGIRVSGNTSWLKKRYFRSFMDYEALVEMKIGSMRMIALCTFQLDQCSLHEVIDVVNNHQFSFIHTSDSVENLYQIAKFDRMNLVGKMAASIAHEVRNPMTTVRGFLQLLGSREEHHAGKSTFDLMISELDRANEIITEFLSLAKTKPSEMSSQNLNAILTTLYPLLQADAFNHNKKIKLDVERIPELLLNGKEITQLVLNLCRNGLEAMEEGGCLRIQTYSEGDGVVLSVEDEGCGIPPESIDKLGMPFFTTKEEGSGLGLATCYNIVANHNARINVDTCSSGTTFFVRFKLPEVEERVLINIAR
ncbi:MEDS domain-containing protein [Desulfitobacterium sp. THU1]|uniref:MEDS domain-containing protein n=1 Tax=Desulfitobacterium sp. THU1 TaxID=3138072 RepID=UPI00311E94B0